MSYKKLDSIRYARIPYSSSTVSSAFLCDTKLYTWDMGLSIRKKDFSLEEALTGEGAKVNFSTELLLLVLNALFQAIDIAFSIVTPLLGYVMSRCHSVTTTTLYILSHISCILLIQFKIA